MRVGQRRKYVSKEVCKQNKVNVEKTKRELGGLRRGPWAALKESMV
jgi:hypothetical protein